MTRPLDLSPQLAQSMALLARATAQGPDDIARARMRVQVQARLDAIDAEAPARRRSRVRVVALVAAAAALLLLATLVAKRPQPSLRAIALDASGATPALLPYLSAGPGGLSPGRLGKRQRRIVVSGTAVARAQIPGVGSVALVGPGELAIRRGAGAAIELSLSRGLLLAQVDPLAGERVRVIASRTRVEVIGTVFAVDARDGDRVHVAVTRGRVAVSRARVRVSLAAGHVLHGDESTPRSNGSSAVGRALAARLIRHVRSAPAIAPDSADAVTLVVRGQPSAALVSLADGGAALGSTPLAVRLARGRARLRVDAPGHSSVTLDVTLRRGQAAEIGFALERHPVVVDPPRATPRARPLRREHRSRRSPVRPPVPSMAPAPAPVKHSARPARPAAASPSRPATASLSRPATARELYRAAEAAMRRGQRATARSKLTELVQRFPHDQRATSARFEIARLSLAAGAPDRALGELRRMLRDASPTHVLLAPARLLVCRVHLERKRLTRAERCLTALLARHPRSLQADDALFVMLRLALRRRDCARAHTLAARYRQSFPRGRHIAALAAQLRRCAR
ncbi:MAG: PEGA domain-containing protein [Myxococcales bacterium]|nr:PEGA domain-containing protein [Myxococcales bacterium]